MATKTITVHMPDDHAEPAWEVALLFPAQGEWSEDDYLWLTDHTRGMVEFTDGHVEVLPMPTDEHQRIVLFLYRALYAFLAARGLGIVLVAPLRLRLRTGRYREPDLLLLLSVNDPRRSNRYWTGADLVLESEEFWRPVRVREGMIGRPLRPVLADSGGHVQGIPEGHPLPPVMGRGHRHVVRVGGQSSPSCVTWSVSPAER
jgi:Putative restriction endonuclease